LSTKVFSTNDPVRRKGIQIYKASGFFNIKSRKCSCGFPDEKDKSTDRDGMKLSDILQALHRDGIKLSDIFQASDRDGRKLSDIFQVSHRDGRKLSDILQVSHRDGRKLSDILQARENDGGSLRPQDGGGLFLFTVFFQNNSVTLGENRIFVV
jgi:hypothetical protein